MKHKMDLFAGHIHNVAMDRQHINQEDTPKSRCSKSINRETDGFISATLDLAALHGKARTSRQCSRLVCRRHLAIRAAHIYNKIRSHHQPGYQTVSLES